MKKLYNFTDTPDYGFKPARKTNFIKILHLQQEERELSEKLFI